VQVLYCGVKMYQSNINNHEMVFYLSSRGIHCIDLEHLVDSMKGKDWSDQDVLSMSSAQVMDIAFEYSELASTPFRSEDQNDRLGQILEAATQSEILDFWVTEVDHFVGHYMGLLDSDHRKLYKDQQACLAEYSCLSAGGSLSKNPQVTNPVRSR